MLGLFSPNNIDIPLVNFGLHWAGGITSPANPTYTVEELARQLEDSGAKALVTQKAFLQTACAAATKVGLPLERVVLLGDERDETGRHPHWRDISAHAPKFLGARPAMVPKKDLAYLVYSSVSDFIDLQPNKPCLFAMSPWMLYI